MKINCVLHWFTFLAAAMLPLAGSAHADLLVNGSFETGDLTGWNLNGNASLVFSPQLQASEGNYVLALNFGDTGPSAVLSQTINTVIGQQYTLSLDFGANGKNNGTQGVNIELLGSVQLYQGDILDASGNGNATLAVDFDTYVFPFVADSALTTLVFRDLANVTDSMDGHLDNIQITPVPEPGSALLAVAACAFSSFRRRRSRGIR